MKNNKGQGLIEYIIIVAIIAVGSMAVLRHVSGNLNNKLAQIADVLQGRDARANSTRKISSEITGKKDLSNFFKQAASGDAN